LIEERGRGYYTEKRTIACEGGLSQFDDMVIFKPSIFLKQSSPLTGFSPVELERIRIHTHVCVCVFFFFFKS
jgi:hypothetical protein